MSELEVAKPTPSLVTRLMAENAPALQLYARQWCDCAEDVVQESFVSLANLAVTPDNPLGWLYRVVRNRAISAGRSAGRRKRYEAQAAGQTAGWFVADAGQNLDGKAAAAALAQLPEQIREVLVGHLWGGLTFAQLGSLAGCSASTAHRRYESGLAQLRVLLNYHVES